MRRLVWIGCAILVCAVALVGVACGDDDDSSGSATTEQAGTAADAPSGGAADAAAAGEAAAKAAGPTVDLPTKTAGIVRFAGSLEADQRIVGTMEEGLELLGWKVILCDGQGDPVKVANCGNSLLDQKVDIMFSDGIPPVLFTAALNRAKKAGIPWINAGGSVDDDSALTASYYPDDATAGEVLADWLVPELETLEGDVPIADHTWTAGWAKQRSDALKAAIEGTPITIAVTSVTDATDPVQGTQQTVTDQLTANPDLKAFWLDYSSSAPLGAATAIGAKFPGKAFPDRPLLVTFLADQGNLGLLRSNKLDAVVDYPYFATGLVAVDQAAEFFARDTAPSKEPRPDYDGFPYLDYEILTPDNVPAEGEYRTPEGDALAFFEAKWNEEFGLGE
jgi:ABC-type sugar transport system substrate-binding protein